MTFSPYSETIACTNNQPVEESIIFGMDTSPLNSGFVKSAIEDGMDKPFSPAPRY